MASRRIGMFGVEPSEFVDDRKEDGVAALLRRRREELGRDVATVARQLRIRAIYIQAIEEGRLQDLPGTAYAVGFVRAYADYLGLDGNSIVSDYRDELARRSRQNQLIWPVDQVEHKHFPGSIVLVISLVLAVAIAGGWYFASQPGGTGIDLIDQVPEFMKKQSDEPAVEEPAGSESGQTATEDTGAGTAQNTAPATTPTATPTTTPGSTPSSAQAASEPAAPTESAETAAIPLTPPTVPVPGAETAEATTGTVESSAAAPEAATEVAPALEAAPANEPAATQPAETPAAETATPAGEIPAGEIPAGETPVGEAPATQVATAEPALPAEAADVAVPDKRIVLRAAKDSWVEIFDADQKVVLQRILRAGETYAVPDQKGLVMNTGNAGGLVIELDGRAQPSLGSIGVVKRGIILSPDALVEQ